MFVRNLTDFSFSKMDLVATEPSYNAKSADFGVLIGENYDIILKESIDRFFVECQKGISDFSGFLSIFFRLLQARVDPPLETIWFYSAVSSRSINVTEQCPSSRVSRARDLFQVLAASSASCNVLKSVAVMAPVLVELYRAAVELSEVKVVMKEEKKLMRDIEGLLEGILSYASIHCCMDSDLEHASVGLPPCFPDLIRVWMIGHSNRDCEVRENLRTFFPLLSDDICEGFVEGEFGVSHLAGVVIVEAFLLRLCLKFKTGLLKSDLQKELKTWMVGSITGFQNRYFFEILLRMLLEPSLPVTSLLDSEDEGFLRGIINDAMILVEYSTLTPEGEVHLSSDTMKYLALTRLIVVHEAIQLVRGNGDHTKAISYINAFCRSHLPSLLIKWATNQIGMGEKAKPNVTTPQSLIKWLLKLEDQGVSVFDGRFSKFCAKLVNDLPNADYEQQVVRSESKEVEYDLFYIENKGEVEEEKVEDEGKVASIDATFLEAAQTMKLTANSGRRKRKEGQKSAGQTRIKFLKYHLDDSARQESFGEGEDYGTSSGSEVDNPLSNKDPELMEE